MEAEEEEKSGRERRKQAGAERAGSAVRVASEAADIATVVKPKKTLAEDSLSILSMLYGTDGANRLRYGQSFRDYTVL